MLFEKLIVTQLIKKYPAFFMEPEGSSPCSLDPILNQLNPVRFFYPYLSKDQLNVILSAMPNFSQWSLTFGPPCEIIPLLKYRDNLWNYPGTNNFCPFTYAWNVKFVQ